MKRCWALLLLAVALHAAPRRVLYLTHTAGYRHDSIAASQNAMRAIADRTGSLEIVATEDLSVLTADRLREFDVLFFFTSGELALSDEQKRAILDFVRQGKGFGGAHSATDTLYSWAEYGDLIGGYFDGHPWVQEVGINVEDPDHPATRPLGNSFRITDEIYQFRGLSRDKVRVLLTLDELSVDLTLSEVRGTDGEFPLAWCRGYGDGRVFYTALGHFDETWQHPQFQNLLQGALLWLAGEAAGDATPRRASPVIAGARQVGDYVEIYGSGLTSGSTALAYEGAWRLAGAAVLMDGQRLRVIYASPVQVNAVLDDKPLGNLLVQAR